MKTTFSIQLGSQCLQIFLDKSHYLHRYSWNTQRHCHSQYELHILLRGCSNIEVNDKEINLYHGQGILFVPGEYHYPKAIEGNVYRFTLSFAPKTESLAEVMKQRIPSSTVFSVDNRLLQICTDIFQEFAAGNSYKQEQIQSLLTVLIVRLLRLLSIEQVSDSSTEALTEFQQISLIDAFFEKNYARRDGEKKLAQMLNISRRQLIRVLEKNYGMNYRQKLIYARMDCAAWLLRNKSLQISQIAGQVGYTSDSSFYQSFKRHFGMTPNQYREKYKTEACDEEAGVSKDRSVKKNG